MNIKNLINDARGDLSIGALEKRNDWVSNEDFEEWSPGDPPLEYLRPQEQPHHMYVESGSVVKISGSHNVDLSSRCRVPLSSVKQLNTQNGKSTAGYIGNSSPYPNIILITNERVLIFIGEEPQDEVLEFDFQESHLTVEISEYSIHEQGIQYQLLPLENDSSKLHFILSKSEFSKKTSDSSINIDINYSANRDTRDNSSNQTNTQKVSYNDASQGVSLSKIRSLSPREFEYLVAEVWRSAGYSCTVTSKGSDSGIDVIAEKGGERLLIQAKRYTNKNVGVNTVQRVAGLLVDNQFSPTKVIIVTTSEYTSDAISRAEQIDSLSLIDGFEFVSMFE